MPEKTLLVSEIFPPKTGGSGRWFWEIYRRLPREAYMIAAGKDARQDEFDQTHDLRLTRVPLTLGDWGICSLRGFRGYGKAYRAVRRIVKREKIDRIHCGRMLPEGWIAQSSEEASPEQRRRTARASTFTASLELTKDGHVQIRQLEHFGPVYIRWRNGDHDGERE